MERARRAAGLIGPIIVTAKGQANADGTTKGVDRDFITLFQVRRRCPLHARAPSTTCQHDLRRLAACATRRSSFLAPALQVYNEQSSPYVFTNAANNALAGVIFYKMAVNGERLATLAP